MRYDPVPGLEDHPIHFQRWTVRVIKYFGGSIGFFLRSEEKKFDRPPCVSHRSVVEGGTPRGGVPPRGGPPLGGSPPLIKDRIFRKIRKRRCTKPAIRAFWTPKTLIWGGTQNDRFWPFLGVLGGIPGIPPYRGRFEKTNRPPCWLSSQM